MHEGACETGSQIPRPLFKNVVVEAGAVPLLRNVVPVKDGNSP